MFRAHLRLIAAFLVLGIVSASAIGMVKVWQDHLHPSILARQEILEMEKKPPPRIDRGNQEFAKAMKQMAQRDIAAAHKTLSDLVMTYRDSESVPESMRILGEINMDRLLSRFRTPGKVDYEVVGGDSLIRIAGKTNTTVDYIIQVNDLKSHVLHKGDRLMVCELNFEINVSLSDKTVTLLRDGKFFKKYPIRMTRGVRAVDTKVESRAAYIGERSVRLGKEGYTSSEKWVSGKNVTFGPYTRATAEDEDNYGIFLDVADTEELYTILRTGSVIKVRK